MYIVGENFQLAYRSILDHVYHCGQEVNVRGNDMRECIPGYFEITNPRDRLLNLDSRPNIYKYIFGELMWYLSGRDDVEFISKYSKIWRPLSDDGIHSNSAYGKYIFRDMPVKGWGVTYNSITNFKIQNVNSQWEYMKEILKKDPNSRQAVIQIKPIQMYDTKDVTCTYFLQFFIRNNKLDLVVGMRSNDIIFGTTYDVFMFTFLQELMAAELGVELGTYKHFAANIHMYMRDKDKVEAILAEDVKDTLQFAKIPSDFRKRDLPILLKLEKQYWESDAHHVDVNLIDKLSNVGKQLISFLIDGKSS